MNRRRLAMVLTLWLASSVGLADPIHAIADDAYRHHDSGFVFLPAIGEFSLVGVPQDVAGSSEAIAYYARGIGNERIVVTVDVSPADSAVSAEAGEPFHLAEDGVSARRAVSVAADSNASTIRYVIAKHDWRVRIEVRLPSANAASIASIDALVRGQRWASLASI